MVFPYSATVQAKAAVAMLPPPTHAGVVQQALQGRLRFKTVGTPSSFPLHYSNRGFSVTQLLTHFLL